MLKGFIYGLGQQFHVPCTRAPQASFLGMSPTSCFVYFRPNIVNHLPILPWFLVTNTELAPLFSLNFLVEEPDDLIVVDVLWPY